MTTNRPWKRVAMRMAKEGRTVKDIAEELGMGYWEVHEHVCRGRPWSSWLGAKKYITNRLNQMAASDDERTREKLRDDVADAVNFLYYAGRGVGKKLDSARDSPSD